MTRTLGILSFSTEPAVTRTLGILSFSTEPATRDQMWAAIERAAKETYKPRERVEVISRREWKRRVDCHGDPSLCFGNCG